MGSVACWPRAGLHPGFDLGQATLSVNHGDTVLTSRSYCENYVLHLE